MKPPYELNQCLASEWDEIKVSTKNNLKKHFFVNRCIDNATHLGPLLLVLIFQWPGAVFGAQHIQEHVHNTILIANTAIDQLLKILWSFILSL